MWRLVPAITNNSKNHITNASLSGLDPLEGHLTFLLVSEERLDREAGAELPHPRGGREEILTLPFGKPQLRYLQPLRIERAVLLGDQHDAIQTVRGDQELQLGQGGILLAVGGKVAGETRCFTWVRRRS